MYNFQFLRVIKIVAEERLKFAKNSLLRTLTVLDLNNLGTSDSKLEHLFKKEYRSKMWNDS